jgi:hypothetical protein
LINNISRGKRRAWLFKAGHTTENLTEEDVKLAAQIGEEMAAEANNFMPFSPIRSSSNLSNSSNLSSSTNKLANSDNVPKEGQT